MPEIIFTVVHSHNYGTSHYVFKVDLPEDDPNFPLIGWRPDIDAVIDALEIDFESHKGEAIEIERQGPIDTIKSIDKNAKPKLRCDEGNIHP